jgi:hypothetical protein
VCKKCLGELQVQWKRSTGCGVVGYVSLAFVDAALNHHRLEPASKLPDKLNGAAANEFPPLRRLEQVAHDASHTSLDLPGMGTRDKPILICHSLDVPQREISPRQAYMGFEQAAVPVHRRTAAEYRSAIFQASVNQHSYGCWVRTLLWILFVDLQTETLNGSLRILSGWVFLNGSNQH